MQVCRLDSTNSTSFKGVSLGYGFPVRSSNEQVVMYRRLVEKLPEMDKVFHLEINLQNNLVVGILDKCNNLVKKFTYPAGTCSEKGIKDALEFYNEFSPAEDADGKNEVPTEILDECW